MKKLLLLAFFALFLLPANASHPASTLVNITASIECTSSDVVDGYDRCIVDGGTLGSMIGAVEAGTHVHLNETLIDGIRSPSTNTVLLLRDVNIDADDVLLNFSGFDSIVLEDVAVSVIDRGIAFYPVRYFNATDTRFSIEKALIIQSTYANFQDTQMESLTALSVYAPFINGTTDSSLTGSGGVLLFDHGPNRPAPAQLGRISLLGNLTSSGVYVHGDNSDVYLRSVNASTIQIWGRYVTFGDSKYTGSANFPIGREGSGAANVTIVASADFTQNRHWPIYGKNISIYAGGNMLIKDRLDAYSTSTFGALTSPAYCFQEAPAIPVSSTPVVIPGQITLAGAGSLTLESTGVLKAENCLLGSSSTADVPSISLSFPNGNVLIKGKLDTYNGPPIYEPRRNAIEINAGNLVVQDSSAFKIEAAGLVTIRAPSLTIPESVTTAFPDKIRGDLSNTFADDEKPIKLYSCSSAGIPAFYAANYFYNLYGFDSSACPNPRPLNIYGYLTTPTGTPYVAGSAKVNWIRVAIPNGPYIAEPGSLPEIHSDIFSTRNGFFSFSIPDVSITPGVYKINATFSTNSSFNCTAGVAGNACQNREIIATALPS